MSDGSDGGNLFVALRAAFARDRGRTVVETAGGERKEGRPGFYTGGDLDDATAMLANALDSLDLAPASRIVVQVEKSVEALLLYLAVLRAGHVHVPLNTAYKSDEIAFFLGDAEPAVLVCRPADFPWASTLAFRGGVRHVFTLGADGEGSLLERASHFGRSHAPARKAAGDVAAILYTSGTTGRSKGAMLTHGNLLSNARVLHEAWRWSEGDVLVHALPIFHVHGLFVAANGALLAGAKMLWLDRFDAAAVLALLPRASVFMGVPTLYVRLIAEAGLARASCAAMRLFVSGSAPLLVDTFETFRARTGHTILERYGMSETLMNTSNPYDGERRGGTVGPPLPGVELRIRDAAGGGLAAAGETGGIELRGPNVFAGYWRLPEKTREEFTDDGWFRTGDVGRLSNDGYLTIVGRSKDLVISGGFNVYPAEVEGWIDALDGVAESAVVGVPHADFGEAVLAVVVPRPGARIDAAEAIAALKSRIAAFKVPKDLVVVDELPRNAMGKVQKNELRRRYAGRFS